MPLKKMLSKHMTLIDLLKCFIAIKHQKVMRKILFLLRVLVYTNQIKKLVSNILKIIAGLNQIREKDIEKSFLGREYDRIEKVNENSVLGLYMMQKTLPKKQSNNTPIFPFGFNLSQK